MPMVQAYVEVEFEAYCAQCGDGICHLVDSTHSGENIRITPCENCIEGATEEGREEAEREKDSEIEDLNDDIYDLKLTIDEKNEEISDLEDSVTDLKAKVAELEKEVEQAREEGWSEGYIEGVGG